MQALKPHNKKLVEIKLSEDELKSLVELFYWLKTIRDNNTQVDTLEPNYFLNYTDNEIERLVG